MNIDESKNVVSSDQSRLSRYRLGKFFAIPFLLLIGVGIVFMGSYRAANEASNSYLLTSATCFDSETGEFFSLDGSMEGTTLSGLTYDECVSSLNALSTEASVNKSKGDTGRAMLLVGLVGFAVTALVINRSNKVKLKNVAAQNSSAGNDLETRLSRLQELLDSGQISQSEHAEARMKVISES